MLNDLLKDKVNNQIQLIDNKSSQLKFLLKNYQIKVNTSKFNNFKKNYKLSSRLISSPILENKKIKEELESSIKKAKIKLINDNNLLIIYFLKILFFFKVIKDVVIKIKEIDKELIILSPELKLKYIDGQNNFDIMMSYDSLKFCLDHKFGAETLWVNSRFTIKNNHPKSFFKIFYPIILNNQGYRFPFIKFIFKNYIQKYFLSLYQISRSLFFRIRVDYKNYFKNLFKNVFE